MPDLVPVLNKDDITKTVQLLAKRISSEYHGRELVLIAVLKGAFVFLSDLIRQITIPVKIDFIRVSSYGDGTSSSGKIEITKTVDIDIKDKDVLIIEDIVDTGLTLSWLIDYFKSLEPKTVKVCALIDKYERRKCDIDIDYVGHVVDKGFLVGYGLDYAEEYRNLPEIYHLKL
jgi:hypoxanthine phosphoribosyltransferase